jgi:hypothetical protein
MPDFLAAVASDIFEMLLLLLLAIRISSLVLIVVLTFVLANFAAIILLLGLAAAPPHLSVVAPLRLMGFAGPVEVLLLKVFSCALLANLLVILDSETLILDPLNPLPQFKVLILQLFYVPDCLIKILSKFVNLL